MFFIKGTYIKPIEEVDNVLPAHYEFLEKYFAQKKFVLAGRRVPRNGGIILCNAKDQKEVEEILKEDVFYEKNIMQYEIIEFTPTKYLDELKGLMG
ncbi:MAG: YciI family protein [Chitinophagales bacterium]